MSVHASPAPLSYCREAQTVTELRAPEDARGLTAEVKPSLTTKFYASVVFCRNDNDQIYFNPYPAATLSM